MIDSIVPSNDSTSWLTSFSHLLLFCQRRFTYSPLLVFRILSLEVCSSHLLPVDLLFCGRSFFSCEDEKRQVLVRILLLSKALKGSCLNVN